MIAVINAILGWKILISTRHVNFHKISNFTMPISLHMQIMCSNLKVGSMPTSSCIFYCVCRVLVDCQTSEGTENILSGLFYEPDKMKACQILSTVRVNQHILWLYGTCRKQPVACIHVWYRQAVHVSPAPSSRIHVQYSQGGHASHSLPTGTSTRCPASHVVSPFPAIHPYPLAPSQDLRPFLPSKLNQNENGLHSTL